MNNRFMSSQSNSGCKAFLGNSENIGELELFELQKFATSGGSDVAAILLSRFIRQTLTIHYGFLKTIDEI